MTYKPRRERRAMGGKAVSTEPLPGRHGLPPEKENQYNAKGSPEEKEEHAGPGGFRRGGAPKKRKAGGHVEGKAAHHHMGKRARGGSTEHHGLHAGHHEKKRAAGGPTSDEMDHLGMEYGHRHSTPTEHRMEERKRGGHVTKRAKGGGAPFSAAHHLMPPGNDKKTGPGEDTETIP